MTWRGAVFLLEERLEVQAAAEECLLMYQWPYALWQQGVKATWDGRIVDDERVALAPQWSYPAEPVATEGGGVVRVSGRMPP